MPWLFAVIERRHELQNPTEAEKLRQLGVAREQVEKAGLSSPATPQNRNPRDCGGFVSRPVSRILRQNCAIWLSRAVSISPVAS
jgi:hypothetical protein